MMKKQLLSFVALLCVVWLTPARAATYDFMVGGIYYKITSSSNPLTVEVANNGWYNFNVYVGAKTIPETVTYNNVTYTVTSIGSGAFTQCEGLTSIEIPASVTSIGREAFFNCRGLTSIVIPFSVTTIGEQAFESCSGLTSIEISASLTSIGRYAFDGCSRLTSIEIPASVTSIGTGAFAACSGLTSIEIPASVTSIGSGAFSGCSGLTSIVVAAENPNYDSRENCNALIETSSNTLLRGCNTTVIPASVTSIGDGAFSGCTGLTSIEIPASVASIGNYAFNNCSGLTQIISRATVPPTCDKFMWYDVDKSTCMLYVPSGSKEAYAAAEGWSYFEKIEEMSYTFMVDGIYYIITSNSDPLTVKVTKKDGSNYSGAITIPERASYNNVTYSVTSIGDYAFNGCSGLTSIEIPSSVTSIGDYAFFSCSGVTKIISRAIVPPTCGEYVWLGNYWWDRAAKSTCTLYVPAGSKEAYAAADGWGYFENIEEITDDFEKDGIYYKIILSSNPLAVEVTKKNGSYYSGVITIPERVTYNNVTYSVTSIGDYAFNGCSGLTSIEIPSSVTSIGDYAFFSCSGVTKIISRAIVPPTCGKYVWLGNYWWDCAAKSTCTLYVPAGSKEAYAASEGWGYFENIEEFDATDITTLDAEVTDTDLSDCEIYTAGGQRVDELQAGMNIVRMKNGKVKKIVKR